MGNWITNMKTVILTLFLTIISGYAYAQSPDVTTTSELFKEWNVRCVGNTGNQQCNMNNTLRAESGEIVSVINLTHVSDQTTLEIGLPLMLDLQQKMSLLVDGNSFGDLPYATCNNRACFVISENDNVILGAFSEGSLATFSFTMYNQQQVKFDVSLQGFSAALSALKTKVQ